MSSCLNLHYVEKILGQRTELHHPPLWSRGFSVTCDTWPLRASRNIFARFARAWKCGSGCSLIVFWTMEPDIAIVVGVASSCRPASNPRRQARPRSSLRAPAPSPAEDLVPILSWKARARSLSHIVWTESKGIRRNHWPTETIETMSSHRESVTSCSPAIHCA